MNRSPCLTLKIAEITFSIEGDGLIRIPEEYQPFIDNGVSNAHIYLYNCKRAKTPLPKNYTLIFNSKEVWKLYRSSSHWLFAFHPEPINHHPRQIIVFDRNFSCGNLFSAPVKEKNTVPPNSFIHPMMEVIAVCTLAKREGVLCHACGVDNNGEGYLFLGHSGDGKSTMAGFWKGQATILNDDRIILRKKGEKFWIYGTPWHGDLDAISPEGVPVKRIFFLKHGKKNSASQKKGAEAVSILLTRSFLPLWNRKWMRYTLNLCSQVVASVPCYELSFASDRSVIEFLKNLKN